MRTALTDTLGAVRFTPDHLDEELYTEAVARLNEIGADN